MKPGIRISAGAVVALALLLAAPAPAQEITRSRRHGEIVGGEIPSHLFDTQRDRRSRAQELAGQFPYAFRTLDGTGNHLSDPLRGSAGIPFLRRTTVAYENGTDAPAGQHRPSARELSNVCVAQHHPVPNGYGATDYLWQWGQFLDHDMDLAPIADPAEPFPVPVPLGDPMFDPFVSGHAVISLNRSAYVEVEGVRQQVNVLTAFIDASNVYGSSPERATELRTLDGTGRLKTSEGDLLPFNVNGLHNDPTDQDPSFYLAGDTRANEQIGLTALHTLFVREHNWWAERFQEQLPFLDEEVLYQLARGMVAAEMQAITYREFLPLLLGPDALPPYEGYDPAIDPGIANSFAAAAYRVGHTMLSGTLLRLQADSTPIEAGNIRLADAFFSPSTFAASGLEPILRGLAGQAAQEIDPLVIDDVRNFLFGPPGAGGFDLASLNIQRGRDHGLPGYNQVRRDFGLEAKGSIADINPDPKIRGNLEEAYVSVEDVDLWVGGLAEPHAPGAMVGETFFVILRDQFLRLRDGDRFYYEAYLPEPFLTMVEESTLARIIRRNTEIGDELQDDVFLLP